MVFYLEMGCYFFGIDLILQKHLGMLCLYMNFNKNNNMKKTNLLISTALIFVFIFFYQYLIHGICLKGIYEQTPHLWRSAIEMNNNIYFLTFSQLLYAFCFTLFFAFYSEKITVKKGLQFGAFVGLLMALPQLGMYAYMPISLELVLYWMLTTLLEAILCGVVLSLLQCCFQTKKEI